MSTFSSDTDPARGGAALLLDSNLSAPQSLLASIRPSAPGIGNELPLQIVGREHELIRLREAADSAFGGRGKLVLIEGEAGIGKTLLIEAIRAELANVDAVILEGTAYETSIASPFGIWIDALHDIVLGEDLPGLPRELHSAASELPAESRASLFHDVLVFIEALTEKMPAVIFLEDLHWSDAASLDLLRYVGRTTARLQLLIVGTYRQEAIHDTPLYQCLPHLVREGPSERIHLHRLVTSDVRRLVRARYGLDEEETARLAIYLQDLADGNPLFIEELLRTLEGNRTLALRNGAWQLGELGEVAVPLLIQQLIDSRLDGLDRRSSDVVGAAAVLGEEVSLADWMRLIEDEVDFERAVESALQAQVMREIPGTTDRMRFTHAIVRRAIYARLLPTVRQRLHRAIGEMLATRPGTQPGVIAEHFEQAGDYRQAVEWLVRAGDDAREIHAYESAVDLLTRALELTDAPTGETAIMARRSRAQAYSLLGDFDNARDDFETALRHSRGKADREFTWRLLLDLGFLWTQRDYAEANDYLEQALDLAREIGSDELTGASLNRVGNLLVNAEQPRAALDLHQEALEIFESLDDTRGITETIDLLALANYMLGDYEQCASLYQQAIRRFREAGDLHGQASALPTLMCAGGASDAETFVVASGSRSEWLRYGHQGVALAREAGWKSGEAYARITVGFAEAFYGRYGAAIEMVDQGLALAERIGHRQWTIAGKSYRGMVFCELLQADLAREWLEQAHDQAREIHSRIWLRATSAYLVDTYLLTGDIERAERALNRAFDAASAMDSASIRQCWMRRARLDIVQGNPDQALEILHDLIATAPGDTPKPSIPHLDWLCGQALMQARRFKEARRAFDLALDRAIDLDAWPLTWRIWQSLARLSSATSDRRTAALARSRGREVFHLIAESIDDEDLRASFLSEMPEEFAIGQGGDLAGDPFGLSAREREVLQVASEGLTDAEIGVRLSISPRTVGRHLQSIYTKLGVNSRTAAVARGFEHDLIERRS